MVWRHLGVDVFTVQGAGKNGASDREQLSFAISQGRVIVTMDSDFLLLTSEDVSHTDIAYANPRSIGDLIGSLMLVYHVLNAADMTNHIEFV